MLYSLQNVFFVCLLFPDAPRPKQARRNEKILLGVGGKGGGRGRAGKGDGAKSLLKNFGQIC